MKNIYLMLFLIFFSQAAKAEKAFIHYSLALTPLFIFSQGFSGGLSYEDKKAFGSLEILTVNYGSGYYQGSSLKLGQKLELDHLSRYQKSSLLLSLGLSRLKNHQLCKDKRFLCEKNSSIKNYLLYEASFTRQLDESLFKSNEGFLSLQLFSPLEPSKDSSKILNILLGLRYLL